MPMQVSFRDVEATPEIHGLIQRRMAHLERICGWVISCRMAVEKPQGQHQNMGNPYRVRIDLRLPHGHELVAENRPGDNPMHESLHAVITDTFKIAERLLREQVEIMQGKVKTHANQELARAG